MQQRANKGNWKGVATTDINFIGARGYSMGYKAKQKAGSMKKYQSHK